MTKLAAIFLISSILSFASNGIARPNDGAPGTDLSAEPIISQPVESGVHQTIVIIRITSGGNDFTRMTANSNLDFGAGLPKRIGENLNQTVKGISDSNFPVKQSLELACEQTLESYINAGLADRKYSRCGTIHEQKIPGSLYCNPNCFEGFFFEGGAYVTNPVFTGSVVLELGAR